MSYSQYVPTHERPVISTLIKLALEGGGAISVYDGCEYVLKRSTSAQEVRSALGHAGEDWLRIRDNAGAAIGWFYLIYNNGSEGDPLIVICDYSANAFCDAIYSALHDKCGR